MIPTRTCIVCRSKKNKNELFRIVANNDNENVAIYDKDYRYNRRGIYICKDKECINKCKKIITKNRLKLKISLNMESLNEILNKIDNELGE